MKRWLALVCIALALLLAGCGRTLAPVPPVSTPSPISLATLVTDGWAALRQVPLQIPTLTPGEPCPIVPGNQVSSDFGDALGAGPLYLVGFGQQGLADLGQGSYQNGLYNLLVLLIAAPSTSGDILVRGRQMYGPAAMRFGLDVGSDSLDQWQLSPNNAGESNAGWLTWSAYMGVSGPGCYGLQIDGAGFSEILVFQAVK